MGVVVRSSCKNKLSEPNILLIGLSIFFFIQDKIYWLQSCFLHEYYKNAVPLTLAHNQSINQLINQSINQSTWSIYIQSLDIELEKWRQSWNKTILVKSTIYSNSACTKPGKWAVMYYCAMGFNIVYNFSVGFWSCSNSVVVYVLFLILFIFQETHLIQVSKAGKFLERSRKDTKWRNRNIAMIRKFNKIYYSNRRVTTDK